MSAQELGNRKGCNRRVVLFFVFAIACVAALFIIGIVRTCTAEHEEKEEEKSVIFDDVSMNAEAEVINLFS